MIRPSFLLRKLLTEYMRHFFFLFFLHFGYLTFLMPPRSLGLVKVSSSIFLNLSPRSQLRKGQGQLRTDFKTGTRVSFAPNNRSDSAYGQKIYEKWNQNFEAETVFHPSEFGDLVMITPKINLNPK